jgi:hypothetical protein
MADLSEAVLVDTSAFLELEDKGEIRAHYEYPDPHRSALTKAFKAVMVSYSTWKR